jgi:acetylglutamate kinase
LKQNVVPVFAPLTHGNGEVLNTNADTIASVLAVELSKHFDVRLIYCFEKRGVLKNINDEESVIHSINQQLYDELIKSGILADGILPKLENAFDSIHAGVHEVLIGHAEDLTINLGRDTKGTLITK